MSASRSSKMEFSLVTSYLPIEDFAKLFKIIAFLLLVAVALNKGWSSCKGQELCVELHYIKQVYYRGKNHTWKCTPLPSLIT